MRPTLAAQWPRLAALELVDDLDRLERRVAAVRDAADPTGRLDGLDRLLGHALARGQERYAGRVGAELLGADLTGGVVEPDPAALGEERLARRDDDLGLDAPDARRRAAGRASSRCASMKPAMRSAISIRKAGSSIRVMLSTSVSLSAVSGPWPELPQVARDVEAGHPRARQDERDLEGIDRAARRWSRR